MKKTFFVLAIMLCSYFVFSQQNQQVKIGKISGRIFDKDTRESLLYTNVIVYNLKDSTIVDGMMTDERGDFDFNNITVGNFYIKIISLGYETKTINELKISKENSYINLGKIYISKSVEMLGEVTIEEQVNDVDYKLDKKVIHINQDIVSAGQTAVEVLENVPSVTTDIDGNVSLRGTESFLVLIDGRPSPLQGSEALQQIPAGSIENIEIITNPSAKYAADGVGGIINIVLKKNQRKGYNGQIAANYGSFNSFGGNALFNFRTNKFNFFVGADINSRNNKGKGFSKRETYINSDTTMFIENNSENQRKGLMWNARAGFDYYITDNDIITISGKYNQNNRGGESEDRYSNYFTDFDNKRFNDLFYISNNFSNSKGSFFNGDINYLRKFKKEGHELQTYFNFSSENNKSLSNFAKTDSDSDFNKYNSDEESYQTRTDYSGQTYSGKIDYTLPLFEEGKLEAGWEMKYSTRNNDYNYQTKIGDNWNNDPLKHNPYTFKNDVQSAYVIFSNIWNKLGYQVGIRAELTDRNFIQTEKNTEWPYKKIDYFPSVHLSYQLPKDMEIMASYSRRLRRPDSRLLDPFEEIQDANNIRQGNPLLAPEYTNSVEVNFQKKIKSHFLSAEIYARQTNDKMDRITMIHPLYDSIQISTSENIGKDLSIGTELMANINIFKWWNFNLTGNLFYYQILSDKYDNKQSFSWNVRLNNTFRITKWGTMIQFGGFYMAPSITAQGKRFGSFVSNFGLRQDFFNKKLSVSFNLRDIFRTGKWRNETTTDRFYSYSENSRYSPTFNISVTYKLNDFKIRKEKSSSIETYSGEDEN